MPVDWDEVRKRVKKREEMRKRKREEDGLPVMKPISPEQEEMCTALHFARSEEDTK